MAPRKKSTTRKRSKDASSDIELVINSDGNAEDIKSATRTAFMGLAISNFASNDDLHRGPRLTMCAINSRQMNKKRRDQFVRAVGGDPLDLTKPLKDLSRFDPQHAITVLVERRFLNQASLVKNPLDIQDLKTLQHVQWIDNKNFSQSQGTVANGNGRIDFCRTVLAPKLNEARLKLERDIASKPKTTILAKLKQKYNQVLLDIEDPASWLVAYYDLDMINASPHALQIKLALAANTPVYQVPDSEDEALDLILNNIGHLPANERLENLKSHSSISLIACGPKRLSSVVNNTTLILQVINLHRYSQYWPGKGFTTNQLYDWRTGVSPFIKAILKQGIALLDYLSSDIEPPEDKKTPIPELNPYPDFFDYDFFHIASQCYATHLFPCRQSYGIPEELQESGQPSYTFCYAHYLRNLKDDITQWCKNHESNPSNAGAAKIFRTLPKRLDYALTSGLFNTAQYGLTLPTLPPILCKYFVIDVGDFLAKYRYPIMEINRMLEPLYCGALVESRRYMEFKDQPMEMLSAWVARYDSDLATSVVVNNILSIIYQHRNTALIKMVAEDLGIPPRYPPRTHLFGKLPPPRQAHNLEEAQNKHHPIWSEQFDALISLMKQWRHNQVDGTVIKVLTDYPKLVHRPKTEMAILCKLEHGDILLDIITHTVVHWAAFSPTQLSPHIKTIAGYAINSLWMHLHHGRRYLAHNEVWDLRQDLVDYLSGALDDFTGLWDGLTEQQGGRKLPMSQTPGSGPRKLVLENVVKRMEGKTQETIKHIVQLIMHQDLGAIPAKVGDLVLPKEVFKAAQSLFAELAVASWKAQTMYTDLDLNRLLAVSSAKRKELFKQLPLPDTFKEATEEEMCVYYDGLTEIDLKRIHVSGMGSSREQDRITKAQNKVRKRMSKINRALGGPISPEEVGVEHLLDENDELETLSQKTDDSVVYDDSAAYLEDDTNIFSGSEEEEEASSEDSHSESDNNHSEKETEVDSDAEEEALENNNSSDKGSNSEEEESASDEEDTLPVLVGKRKREVLSSSLVSEPLTQRRRLDQDKNSTDRRTEELADAISPIKTPPTDAVLLGPPDAPKGEKIGQVDSQTPESTFPKAKARHTAPAMRDSTPEYLFTGYDNQTLNDMASVTDHLTITPTSLFNMLPNAMESNVWSSPDPIASSSSAPQLKRALRPRNQNK